MKAHTIYTCLFAVLLGLLYACSNQSMDNPDKRNESWVWFVNKDTGKGEWVPIKDKMSVPDGNYTAFYFNGKVREKGKIANLKRIDTIYYYSLNEDLIKYTILRPDSLFNYYVQNGQYKEYSPKGELRLEGMVKDHRISNHVWYGPYSQFIEIYDAVIPAADRFTDMAILTKNIILEAAQNNFKPIPSEKYSSLKALCLKANYSAKSSLVKLDSLKPLFESAELISSTKDLVKTYLEVIQAINQVNELMKNGLSEKERAVIVSMVKKLQDNFPGDKGEKALDDYISKNNFTPDQDTFFNQRYPTVFTKILSF
jgi:hypothetical protein